MELAGQLETHAAGKTLLWNIYVGVVPESAASKEWPNFETLEAAALPIAPEWRDSRVSLPSGLVATVVKTRSFAGSDVRTLVTPTYVKVGKNIGKKNQTNALTQAIKEAEAELRKRKEKKLDEFVRPMLAKEVELDELDSLPYPLMVQEKIDGVRVLVKSDGSLQSRGGKPLPTPPHLARDLRALASSGFVWDGELYACTDSGAPEPLQYISGAARGTSGKHPGDTERVRARLFVYLYDALLPGTYRERLAAMRASLPSLDHCRLLDTDEVAEPAAVREAFERVVARGGEGLILRYPDEGVYKQSVNSARSPQLLKLKAEYSAEAVVVDVVPGKRGADQNAAVFVLRVLPASLPARFRHDARPIVFDSVPNMTRREREQVLRARDEYLGKIFTFSFQDLSKDGAPLRARVVAERFDYEDAN